MTTYELAISYNKLRGNAYSDVSIYVTGNIYRVITSHKSITIKKEKIMKVSTKLVLVVSSIFVAGVVLMLSAHRGHDHTTHSKHNTEMSHHSMSDCSSCKMHQVKGDDSNKHVSVKVEEASAEAECDLH
jgi:hypothetical protein